MLYKRGKFWWDEFHIGGRKIRQSTKTEDRSLAEQIAEARRSQALLCPHGGYSQFITLAEAAKLWHCERRAGWTHSTESAARYNLRHLVGFFGCTKLHRITPLAIGTYQSTRLVEGASAATINQETTTLRSLLRKARLWEDLRPDVKRLRQRTDVGRALEELELRRLLAAARTCPSESLHTAILLSVHTGLRRFELCNLQWCDIDRRKHTLRVMRSKTEAGTGRIVPLIVIRLPGLRSMAGERSVRASNPNTTFSLPRVTASADAIASMRPAPSRAGIRHGLVFAKGLVCNAAGTICGIPSSAAWRKGQSAIPLSRHWLGIFHPGCLLATVTFAMRFFMQGYAVWTSR